MASLLPSKGTYSIATAVTACVLRRSAHCSPRRFQLLARTSNSSRATTQRFLATSFRRQDESETHTPSMVTARINTVPGKEKECQTEETKKQLEVNESELLKTFMRTVPHPVAVITARRESETSGPNAYVGATVSSFNTVSFVPEPIISFNLLKDSVTLRSIRANAHFVVNLLRDNAQGAELANLFTKGNDPSPFMKASEDSTHPLKFFSWKHDGADTLMPPVVHMARSAGKKNHATAFAVLCELKQIVDVGDHVVVLGRALQSCAIPADNWGPNREDQPSNHFKEQEICLSYVHGAYSGSQSQSARPPSWLNRDLYRDVPIKMINEHGLEVLAMYYGYASGRIQQGIERRESGGLEDYDVFTNGYNMEELKVALSYFQARHNAAIKHQKQLRQNKVSNLEPVATISPPLNLREKAQFRTKSSMKNRELLSQRTIYQQKLTQLEHLQKLKQNIARSEDHASTEPESPKVDLDLQLQIYHRKLQIVQAAIIHKLQLEAISDGIQDLIPVVPNERALLNEYVSRSFSNLRDQLLRMTRKTSLDQKGDLDKVSTNQKSIESAVEARIIQTAMILKMMANLPEGKEAEAARKYIEASYERAAHPGFRKVYASDIADDTQNLSQTGEEYEASSVDIEQDEHYEQM